MRDNTYRDNAGTDGMQEQLKDGSPADRVQGVIADEATQANANFMELVAVIERLIVSIKTLVTIIGIMVSITGLTMCYLVVRG